MASNWKGHRGINDKSRSQLSSAATSATSNSQSGNTDRNDVPQRPPTVGQELPNNLVPSLQDWQLEPRLKPSRNRKKGNLEKNRERKSEASAADGNALNGARFNAAPVATASHLQMQSHRRHRLVASDCESASDGDANVRQPASHGTRSKREVHNLVNQAGNFHQDNEPAPAKVMHNTAKRLNTNHAVGKLAQVREYINQVTSTMEALENLGDPSVMDKFERLRKVRLDLVENEQNLVELLQRVSFLQNEQANAERERSNSDAESVASVHRSLLENVDSTDNSEDSGGDGNDGIDHTSDSLQKRNELLLKVAESQEKLKALQDQQALLMALQHQAENRLAEARTFHDHLVSKPNGTETTELSAEEVNTSRSLQRDLMNIEQRLARLQDLQANREQMDPLSRSVDGEANGPDKDEKGFDLERQELHDKLQDLQVKKKQMDDLLSELCSLRETRLRENQQSVQNGGAAKSEKKHMVVTKDSVAAAQQSLKSSDVSDKMRKIDEMRSWLYSMENIVSNLQSEHGSNIKGESKQQVLHGNRADSMDAESPRPVLGSNQARLKKSRKTKTDNLSREQSNERVGRLPSNQALVSNTERRHHPHRDSSTEEPFAEDSDVQIEEKTRKLHEAKFKLQKLQDLLATVQNRQQSGQLMNADYVERLLNSIENEDEPNLDAARIRSPSVSPDHRASIRQADAQLLNSTKVNKKPHVSQAGQHHQSDRVWNEQHNAAAARAERGRRKSNSTRDSIGSASKLLSSNQELWVEMRNEMALHEELHQRRQELERLMRKDAGKNNLVNQDTQSEIMSASAKSEPLLAAASIGATDATSAATWGGSSIDNGARDMVDGNDSQEERNERIDNEEYSSDEALDGDEPADSVATTQETGLLKTRNCTVPGNHDESDSMWRAQELQLPLIGLGGGGDTAHDLPSSHNTGQFSKASWQQPDRGVNPETADLHSPEDPVSLEPNSLPFSLNVPWQPNASQLHHQMETATLLCQTILRDQNLLSGLAQQSPSLSAATVPLSSINVPDVLQLHHTQLIQQQMLLGLSHCYHLLYLQHVEMQRLRQTLQVPITGGLPFAEPHHYSRPQVRTHTNLCDTTDCQNHSGAWPRHLDNPTVARLSMPSLSSNPPPQSQSQHPGPHDASHGPITETLNNQVPPGNRANNYWDNFRSYSRQNLLSSNSHPNKSNDCPGGRCHTLPRATTAAPAMNVNSHLHGSHGQLLQPQEEFQRAENSVGSSDAAAAAAAGHPRAEENHARSSRNSSKKEAGCILQNSSKDKINKDLSGSSKSSANVLKNRGNLGPKTSSPANQTSSTLSLPTGTLSKLSAGFNKANTGVKERAVQSRTKDAAVNSSHVVDDSVHAEVSKLVSQFDADPVYLIRLLRELRKLNSEQAARNALQALHDASRSNAGQGEIVTNSGLFRPPPPAPPTQQGGSWIGGPNVQRPWQLPRESSSSSDEDRLSRHVKNKKGGRQYSQFSNSWSSYDAANSAVGHFNVVPPPENNVALNSIVRANGELQPSNGATVKPRKLALLDKKHAQVPSQTSGFQLPNLISPPTARRENSASKCASSSVQERDSEASTSDVPCARFNMQQLEQQMQRIMVSVASFIATFSHHNCNSQIISGISSHIVALVLSMIHNASHETWNFIPSQLTGVLENIIQKYIGKRIGDCEESLLVELSEVLFNELAFLQLMQNLDGNSAQVRSQKFHALVQKFARHPREFNSESDLCMGTAEVDSKPELNLPTNLMAKSADVCVGNQAQATDADLVMMARRGDDEDNDKDQEDFSCHNSDINAAVENVGWAASVIIGDEASSFRVSPLHNAANLDPHSLSPLPLPEMGTLATAAEGQGEVSRKARYFDREVEMEGEGIGDTQDLAEADQSQSYMEAESALDDVQEGENFQAWVVDHNLMNGGIDRTEDDQHDEDDPLGAAGGAPTFALFAQVDVDRSGPELGLDEVPIKLRDGSGSRNSNRDRGKEDGSLHDTPEHGEGKGKRAGGSDHGLKP